MSKQQLGDLDFNNVSRIVNLPDPTAAQQAATKEYVDNLERALVTTGALTNTSNVTLVNITELQFSSVGVGTYLFEGYIRYRSSAVGTGIAMTMSIPTGSISGIIGALVGADGTGALFNGAITASGDIVTTSAVPAANVDYMCRIQAIIIVTAAGNIIPQFRSETNGQTITVQSSSIAKLRKVA